MATRQSTLADRLAEIEGRAEGATSAPWSHVDAGFRDRTGHSVKSDPSGMVVAFGGFGPDGGGSCVDAAFIAHARTDVPRMAEALRAVLALHHPNADVLRTDQCAGCETVATFTYYPCPTVTAITAALGCEAGK